MLIKNNVKVKDLCVNIGSMHCELVLIYIVFAYREICVIDIFCMFLRTVNYIMSHRLGVYDVVQIRFSLP